MPSGKTSLSLGHWVWASVQSKSLHGAGTPTPHPAPPGASFEVVGHQLLPPDPQESPSQTIGTAEITEHLEGVLGRKSHRGQKYRTAEESKTRTNLKLVQLRSLNYIRKAGPREGKQLAQGLTASPVKPEPKANASPWRALGRTLGRGTTVLNCHGRMVTIQRTRGM